jgi:hypothetical protein
MDTQFAGCRSADCRSADFSSQVSLANCKHGGILGERAVLQQEAIGDTFEQ